MELVSRLAKLLAVAIIVLLFQTSVYAAREPSPTSATPESLAGTATITTNNIKSIDAVTSNREEFNNTATIRPPSMTTSTTITPIDVNGTDAYTSDEELNITDITGSPTVNTTITSFEIINSTSDDEFNITTTTSSSTVTARTTLEEINSTDAVTPNELNVTSTINNDGPGVTEIATLSGGSRSEVTSELPQNSLTTEQPVHSSRPILDGATLTGVLVASILGGLMCIIICVVASIIIALKIKRREQKQKRAEVSATDFSTVYAPWPEFKMTRNTAYHTGKQMRASRSSNSRAVTGHNNRPKVILPPKQYTRINDRHIDASMDSQGYVKLPRPFVLPKRYNRLNNQHIDTSMDSQGYVKLPRHFV